MPKVGSITTAFVNRKKARERGQTDYFDQQYPGLALRVSSKGRKTWCYVYRFNGEQRRLKLDLYPAMSVAQAHEAWRKARDTVQAGQDPARTAIRPAVDFASVFEEWLKRDQAKNRSVNVVRGSITKHALSLWQHRPINEIGKRDCLDVIDAVADQGTPIAARRLYAYLHRLFQWAIGRDIIETNPMVGVDKPGAEVRRERLLSDGELVKVWNAAERLGAPYGSAFQLLILTGARREEIGRLRWSEIDNNNTIKLEGSRTKNGEAHNIPLSTKARAVLDKLPRIANSEFVFTFSGHVPVSGWTKAKRDLDDFAAITDPWVIHDLRRTCATGLEKLKTPLQVTEAILGHTSGSRGGIVGVYQRHHYAEEKREALEVWGAHVTALVEGRALGKVVPIIRTRP
jgi:integrase